MLFSLWRSYLKSLLHRPVVKNHLFGAVVYREAFAPGPGDDVHIQAPGQFQSHLGDVRTVFLNRFQLNAQDLFQVDPVFSHPIPDRDPVNPQNTGGLALIALTLLQRLDQGLLIPRFIGIRIENQ
jgi:hypothetical protein